MNSSRERFEEWRIGAWCKKDDGSAWGKEWLAWQASEKQATKRAFEKVLKLIDESYPEDIGDRVQEMLEGE